MKQIKQIKVNKIILGDFIDMLLSAYDAGADYIDLVAQQGDENQDALGVLIRPEYINAERHSGEFVAEDKSGGLTTDKLTQLLNYSIN